MQRAAPQDFDRVLSSMCTEPHPAARQAAERFLATNPGDPATYQDVATLETEAIDALGEITGLAEPVGYIATGGTEANIQAVRAARNRADAAAPTVVAPESAHFSFAKAAELLEVDLERVPTDADGRAEVAAMRQAVDEETILVVGVAGTTEYGRVDPIPALAELAHDNGALCHVDAAWGGFILPFTDYEWNFAHAPIDTMTIDPHKLGQAAIPAGGFLARERETLGALAIETPYLESASQVSLAGTRSGAGVASTVAAIEELWPTGYREQFETSMANAWWLSQALAERDFDVIEPRLPLVTVDMEPALFEALRAEGWRIARTSSDELRIVCMPHVTRGMLESFVADIDRLRS